MADTKLVGGPIIVCDSKKEHEHEHHHDDCDCRVDRKTLGGKGTKKRPFEIIGPVTTVVFRPGDPEGSRGNVYVTWDETYAALRALAERGILFLEFDARFSSTVEPVSGIPSVVIPTGTWNMNNVVWTHTYVLPGALRTTYVELADGAQIVFTGDFTTLRILGWNLTVFSNRTGPVAPFTGINILLDGTRCQLRTTLPNALPIFQVDFINLIVISGSNSQGGVGGGGPGGNFASVSPAVDVAGGEFILVGGTGFVKDDTITDSVGGGAAFLTAKDDSFNGDASLGENFLFSSFTGLLDVAAFHRDRWLIAPFVITDIDSPWSALLNELVRVDTSVAPVIVNAPSAATGLFGERFSVIDYTGSAAGNPIVIVPAPGETVDSPVIAANGQSKSWVSDGNGRWMLHATATP